MPAPAANYWSHWGLNHSPFRAAGNPNVFHLSPVHDEALARLHFLLEHRRQVGLVVGEAGSGKSLLLARFAQELRSQAQDAIAVAGYAVGEAELLWSLAAGLRLNLRRDEPAWRLWGRISDRFAERRYQRLHTVLLIDDADRAAARALDVVVKLLQLEAMPEVAVTVVLAAEPRGVAQLGPRLADLAELRIELESWTVEETADFVTASLAKAGQDRPLFEGEAVARLHAISGGAPRRVGRIADLALVAGAGQGRATIDAATIETVVRELTP